MAKLVCAYLFISMIVLSVFLALPIADGAHIRKYCTVVEKLSKPCTFQECQPLCIQKYRGTGVCLGDNNYNCKCEYNC
ncbi:putative defensin-like protein 162 [Raphanus sativus]|uniref:Defensin-like protein 162 n=1 Tax=Raphanus sativus TaxID=3726 RepID=A0A6J0LIL2_RAPSA|nr:putative defensin-like protein 162 [Raphanus sativus]